MELPGRGTIFYRDVAGPEGAPVVVLLHGWTATADLNWFTCYEPLAERFRVIAPDHRGHGRGIRSRKAFKLADCADDAAALCTALGIDEALVVGYSMGGTIAQLMWKRHPHLVPGMVLSSTAANFSASRGEKWSFIGLTGLGAAARVAPSKARNWLTDVFFLSKKREKWGPWAIQEAALHDWRMVLEAGGAIGRFSSRSWLGSVDTPTSVIVTMRDHIVPVSRQVELFERIPGAVAYRVDGDHDACVAEAGSYVPTLIEALEHVIAHRRPERDETTAPSEDGAQIQADVENGGRVGERADGDVVDAGLPD